MPAYRLSCKTGVSAAKLSHLDLSLRKHGGRSPMSESLSGYAGVGAATSAMGSGDSGLDISTDGDAGGLGDAKVSV